MVLESFALDFRLLFAYNSAVTADLIPEVVVKEKGFGWLGFDPHGEFQSFRDRMGYPTQSLRDQSGIVQGYPWGSRMGSRA